MAGLTTTQIRELNNMCAGANRGALGTKIAALEERIETGEEAIGDVLDLTTTSKEVVGAINETVTVLSDALFAESFVHTVTGAEATAGTLDITTGLVGAVGFLIQVREALGEAKPMTNATMALGVITVSNVALANMDLVEGDVISGIVW